MLKMLIVEDERWEREGLLNFLDWQSLGIEIVATACDGVDGIEQAQKIFPDLIITDIKMPTIDGLKMIKKIREFLPDVKTVLLTGYDDFKLAQEAINCSADAYILKPVEEEEMYQIIKNLALKCEKNLEKIEEENHMRLLLNESLASARDKQLLDLYDGRLAPEKIQKLLSKSGMYPDSEEYAVSVIKYSNFENIDYDSVVNDVGEIFCGKDSSTAVAGPNGRIFVCTGISGKADDFIRSAASSISVLLKEKYKLESVIGVGEYANDMNNIHNSFIQAKEAAEFGIFWGRCGYVHYSEVESIHRDFGDKAGDFLIQCNYFSKQMIHVVRSYDKDRTFGLLNDMYGYIRENMGVSRDLICNYLYGIVNETSLLLLSMNKVADSYEDGSFFGEELLAFDNFDAVWKHLFMYFDSLLEYMDAIKNNKDEYIVKKVLHLIEQKYMSDMSLKTIASDIFLSPNYLGSTLKKCTGKSFNDLLCEYRMEKAKELLKNPKSKVSQVANQVGIPNTSYFCMVFKNTCGMAPGEYKQMVIRS